MIAEGQVGPVVRSDGAYGEARLDKTAAVVVSDAHSHFGEAAVRGGVYSLALAATTTGVAAGNIVAAAAAASTNFALFNPVSSGRNYVLLKFGMGIISGTPGAGPLFHGVFTTVPTAAGSGTTRPHLINGANSAAIPFAVAAGTALTGGTAPVTLRVAAFSSTGTAQASPGAVNAVEVIDGDIVLPPGTGWAPLWGAAGTSLLNAYSITWEELPS